MTALGASGITALASLGVTWIGHRLSGKQAADDRRLAAYQDVVNLSGRVATRAGVFGSALRTQGFTLIGGERTVADLLALYDWWARDFDALQDSAGRFWLEGTEEAVTIANDISYQCVRLFGFATTTSKGRSWLNNLKAPQWNEEQVKHWNREIRKLAELRAAFVKVARQDLGRPAVEVLKLHTDLEETAVSAPGAPRSSGS